MAGMQTQLHLLASEPGTYQGLSSNYSGDGFSGMTFRAIAVPSQQGFNAWLAKVRAARQSLGERAYVRLAKPSENDPVAYYSQVQPNLFADIVAGRAHAGGPVVATTMPAMRMPAMSATRSH
jgi:cytochrome o ubiquinol oxidase subunit 2